MLFTDAETNGMINISGCDHANLALISERLNGVFTALIQEFAAENKFGISLKPNCSEYANFWCRYGFSLGIYGAAGNNKIPGRYDAGEVVLEQHVMFRTNVTPGGTVRGPYLNVAIWSESQYPSYNTFRKDVETYRNQIGGTKNPFARDNDFYQRALAADAGTSEWIRLNYPYPHGIQSRFATRHFYQRPLSLAMSAEDIHAWFKLYSARMLKRVAR